MLKLSRSLLLSRNLTSEKISVGIVSDVRDGLYLHALTSEAGIATAGQSMAAKGNIGRRVFAPYSFFKGKAAMSVNPVLPTFIKTESGDLRIHHKGNIMLTFWPSIGERKYDWSRRQKFALSATEVGSLINIGPKDSAEFFHDPSMLSSNAGQVRKSLSIKANADTSGYFVNLNVVNNILKTTDRFVVPVTAAEFAVMKTACSFALPHIMGWDQATNKIPGDSVQNVSKLEPQLFDSEWDR